MPITSSIRIAVIPAAGQGTRMLPVTKAVPKELLPIMERPALQLIVDEAVGAGVEHIVIVTSRSKPAIEQYFQEDASIEASLVKQGRGAMAADLHRYGRDIQVSFVYQDEPRGLGHAVGCARQAVGDQPFFVLLPDELMQNSSLLMDLNEVLRVSAVSAVALKHMPLSDISRYGVITPMSAISKISDIECLSFGDVREKPLAQDAPSDLAIIGRYALTPDIFDDLDALKPGSSGELQLTDALSAQAARQPLQGVISHIGRRDIGNPLGWVEAVIEAALADVSFGADLRQWLRSHI